MTFLRWNLQLSDKLPPGKVTYTCLERRIKWFFKTSSKEDLNCHLLSYQYNLYIGFEDQLKTLSIHEICNDFHY